ncbi:MAG: type II toxin-antitoxin system RelE/ParE family toxin [Patescibacteria group bacterium]
MSYTIEWELNSAIELEKLPFDIANRILEKLEDAKENPEHFVEKLRYMSEFKVRIGDYRVILLLDKINKKLKIQMVGHRKSIYKKYG